jgi:hypothetical protein
MKRFIIYIYLVLFFCISANADGAFKPEFYAFHNGIPEMSYEDEAKMLKELGYDGISQVHGAGEQLAQRVTAYKNHGLKALSVYLAATETPIEANLVQSLANGGMIELTVNNINPKVIESIRQTAEMASQLNIRVALYPHYGNAVATMQQAIDLVEKVGHANLGIMFNLCHFLKIEKESDMECILEKSSPYLLAVSTCGADLEGTTWGELIQTLDKGNFPQKRLFSTLRKLNFKGPVGLQCYAIKGDKRSNLKESFHAWEKILCEL